MTKPKLIAGKRRNVRARVRGGSLDLLDPTSLPEGTEVVVTISESERTDIDSMRRAAGGWKGLVDADALIADIYADRLITTRTPPRA